MPPHHISRFSDQCLRNISTLFEIKLVDIHHEKLQYEHYKSYQAIMFSKRFFSPKLISHNPLRKITNYLGRFFQEIPENAYGHTVIAIYQKK